MKYRIKIYIVVIIPILLFQLGLGVLHGESIFLKNGKIIEGRVIKETDKIIRIQSGNVVSDISNKSVLRRVINNKYKEKKVITKKDSFSIEAHIVYEDDKAYTVRKIINKSEEFDIPKKDVISIKKTNEKEVSDTGKNEMEKIGSGDTWDTYNIGLGIAFGDPTGLMGDNFIDEGTNDETVGFFASVFNSPAEMIHLDFTFLITFLAAKEKTQIDSGVMLTPKVCAGYNWTAIQERFVICPYSGLGYHKLSFDYPNTDTGSIGDYKDVEKSFHAYSMIFGIQFPLRVWRRFSIRPFLEYHWFPSVKAHAGILYYAFSINW